MAKRLRKKEKNISSHKGHSSSSNTIVSLPAGENNKTIKSLVCIFLAVLTFTVYWQVQDHQFLNFDDNVYVTDNLNVQAGLSLENVNWAFTTSYYVLWHPMTWLSHMLDYELYGSSSKGHHLTSLFFHIANSLILFMVLSRMTGKLWQSGFVAAMFAFHPLNVESVAWVAERKNVLSTFFWLLTMWAYVHYVENPSIRRYCLVVLFFALGLMSKPMLVTLPFVLLIMDYWPLKRFKLGQEKDGNEVTGKYIDKRADIFRLVREKTPLFILTAITSIVTFIFQKSDGAVQTMESFSLSARLNNAMVSYLEYLEKTIWPKQLAIFYPHPGNTLAIWKGILCGMVLVGITTVAIKVIKKAPYFAVGWFWYLGTLVPVIGIVQVGTQAMADRYAYVPLIGIFIIAAWGLPELMAKWRHRKIILTITSGIIIPVLMMITWLQVSYWNNSITIFKHAIKVTDKNYPTLVTAHNNLGAALFAKGKTEEAIFYHRTAIRLNPDDPLAYYNLGNALSDENKNVEAVSHYKMAIRLKPDYAEAHENLGNVLLAMRETEKAISHYKTAITLKPDHAPVNNNLANALLAMNATEEAISYYKTAIELRPNYTEAHYNLGNSLFAMREIEEAISHYKMAIRLKPDFAEAHYNIGNALFTMRETEEAISHYKTATTLKPDYIEAHYNLGNAFFAMRKTEDAISQYRAAIAVDPDYAEAHNNLGNALSSARKTDEAISHYKTAIVLKPDYAEAHGNLGNALVRKGKIKEAVAHYRETLRLKPHLIQVQKSLEMLLLQTDKMKELKSQPLDIN